MESTTGPYLASMCFEPSTRTGRPPFTIETANVFDLRVYLTALITIFFVLSSAFQFYQAYDKAAYKIRVETNGTNFIRYIEYSITASVMMVAVACVLGVFDVYIHILAFACTLLCQLLGLLADCLRTIRRSIGAENTYGFYGYGPGVDGSQDTIKKDVIQHLKNLQWMAHYMGWFSMLTPYICVFVVAYFRTVLGHGTCAHSAAADVPREKKPEFVHVIVIIQFILFNSFGFVQLAQFWNDPEDKYTNTEEGDNMKKRIREGKLGQPLVQNPDEQLIHQLQIMVQGDNKRIGINTERRFVLLSLVAKTLLGWVIAANLLFL
jgi:hypothetical protein